MKKMNKRGQIGEAKNIKFSLTPICKRAQIGETMTWVIATIIIIVILVIAIFVTSLLGIVGVSKTYKSAGNYDLIPVKSLTSYLLTSDDSGTKIFNQLKDEEELNDFNGNLALKIFKGFYGKNYKIAFELNNRGNPYFENDIFVSGTDPTTGYRFSSFEKIELDNDNELKLFWAEK